MTFYSKDYIIMFEYTGIFLYLIFGLDMLFGENLEILITM